MKLKILTPEYIAFDGEVKSVLLPGKNGEFCILKNHAAIVSSLTSGKVKLYTNQVSKPYDKNFSKEEKDSVYSLPIKNGVIEFNHNEGIILCEK